MPILWIYTSFLETAENGVSMLPCHKSRYTCALVQNIWVPSESLLSQDSRTVQLFTIWRILPVDMGSELQNAQ